MGVGGGGREGGGEGVGSWDCEFFLCFLGEECGWFVVFLMLMLSQSRLSFFWVFFKKIILIIVIIIVIIIVTIIIIMKSSLSSLHVFFAFIFQSSSFPRIFFS